MSQTASHPITRPNERPEGRGENIVFLSDRNGGWEPFAMGADGSDQREMFPAGLDGIRFRYEFAAERVVSWAR